MCSLLTEILKPFYTWGDIFPFTDIREALSFCRHKKTGIAVFILDVYLGKETAFDFPDKISEKFAWAAEDAVIITGNAGDDVVNMCIASNVTHLLENLTGH